VLMTSFLYG